MRECYSEMVSERSACFRVIGDIHSQPIHVDPGVLVEANRDLSLGTGRLRFRVVRTYAIHNLMPFSATLFAVVSYRKLSEISYKSNRVLDVCHNSDWPINCPVKIVALVTPFLDTK